MKTIQAAFGYLNHGRSLAISTIILAIILAIFRHHKSVDLQNINLLRG